MWVKVRFADSSLTSDGLVSMPGPRPESQLLCSPGLQVTSIEDLRTAEYGHAVHYQPDRRRIRFARDYLGHYPLLFARTPAAMLITDECWRLVEFLEDAGRAPTVVEESLALYLAMGFVPQGHSLWRGIHVCRNAGMTVYDIEQDSVSFVDWFTPIEIEPGRSTDPLKHAIEESVARHVRDPHGPLQVWCSGGFDSTLMAHLCVEQGARPDLVSFSYPEGTEDFVGELPFLRLVAEHYDLPLSLFSFGGATFDRAVAAYASHHHSPAIDFVAPIKMALAQGSSGTVLTGEGGDPLFAGTKNDRVSFLRQQRPELSLGYVYGCAYGRLFSHLPQILRRGVELQHFVAEVLQSLLERYPGDLPRKLLYANTLDKQGGLIFPVAYYAQKAAGVRVRHPLTSLDVYREAFALADERKFVYGKGKIVLHELFAADLPAAVVQRRKSGTRLPLSRYCDLLTDSLPPPATPKTDYFLPEAALGYRPQDKPEVGRWARANLALFAVECRSPRVVANQSSTIQTTSPSP